TGESKPNEHRLLCRDGVYRWQLARATPNRDKSGRIVSWYGTSTDIHELKQAEISLRSQADLLRMAGQLSQLGGWSLELSGMRFVWSDEASAILELPDGIEPTLDTAISYCAPQWQEMARRVAQECMENGTPFDVELEMFTPAGRSLWVRSMARAIRSSDGTITRMQGALQDITERKLADQALLESEQRHAALFDAAPVPMWVIDAQSYHHIAVNETAIRLYGYSREELATMTPVELRPAGAEQARMETLLAAGLPLNQPEQWLHRRKDGSEFPVELVRRMVRYDGKDAVFTVAIDITARVCAEKEIQAYLETLQRAAEAAQRITQQRTPAAVLQEVADQARAIVGAHQAVVGLYHPHLDGHAMTALSLSDKYASYRHLTGQPDGSGITALVRETRQAVRLTQAELEAHPRWRSFGDYAGEHPPMRGWLAVPLMAHDGTAIGLLQLSDKYTGEFTQQDEYVATELAGLAAAAIDNASLLEQVRELNSGLEEKISQRTQDLTRQEALFRTLAEQAPQPIWTIDPRGSATFFSSAWYQLAGGAPPDWYGYAWVELVHPDDLAAMTENWLRSSKNLSPYTGLRRLRAQDGAYHTMSYRASPVFNEKGEVTFWVGIDVDVTETKATEAALRLSNAELEAFSYSVSHDLRSPLNTVDGFSHLLARELDGKHGEKAQHYLARIRAGAGQMGNLIEGLLSLAHVARTELHHAPVDLSLLAHEILERLHAIDAAREVRYRVAPQLLVQGDARLLRSVMENLLGNAWKFSARKDVADIAVGRLAPHGAFFVRDNGAGFDMAHIGKLFGTFQRLHDARDYAGTGVGLATVARVIARHGGRIWAESARGEGATFYFTLPDIDA
ncbi:MAG: PAS domain S-box protein, partial [Polaromonas sp.]